MEAQDDPADVVATDVLVDDAAVASEVLSFRSRSSWVGLLVFGSWGLVITVPIASFIVAGEVPPRSTPLVAVFAAIGLAFCYFAIRSVSGGATLRIDADALCSERVGLWPRSRRRFALGAIATARVEVWPVSFRHPARSRGYPMPRPFAVLVVGRDGRTERLPLVLSSRDASSVAAWIVRESEARATGR